MKTLISFLLTLLLLPALSYAQSTIKATEIIDRINRGETVSYKDARVEGDLDLTQLKNKKLKKSGEENGDTKYYVSTVTAPVSFLNCTFTGKVLGYFNPNAYKLNLMSNENNEVFNTNFEKDVRFENCKFEEEVAFKYSWFYGTVSFAGSTFKEETIFKYAHFDRGGADFSKTVFEEGVSFKYVNLEEGINFANATFRNDADFKYTKFPKGSSFEKATFAGFANFKYAQFNNANLQGISFKNGEQDFKYTQVDGRRMPLTAFSK